MLREISAHHGWQWQVELAADPDAKLIACDAIVASADSHVVDHCGRWYNLAKVVIESQVPEAWIFDLSGDLN